MSLGENDVLYKGSSNQTQFSNTLNKLNFELSNYIYALTDKKDTLYLADYFVPNLYGMGGNTQVILAFEKEKTYNELEIRMKELGFGIGEKQFIFLKKNIQDIPELKL